MQWTPEHRVMCSIFGILPVIKTFKTHTTQRGIYQTPKQGSVGYWSTTILGGTSIFYLSLDLFYLENLRWHNRWSNTNEGYDLARYLGTRVYFPPHDIYWYVVSYDTEFQKTSGGYQYAQPLIMLLTKRHKIVKPRIFGGKGKRMFIPPPSVFNTSWFKMSGYCNAALAKIQVSLCNIKNGMMHNGQTVLFIPIGQSADISDFGGRWKGYNAAKFGSGTRRANIYYRWDWDDGTGNEIALPYARNPSQEQEWNVMKWDAPYWMWFWGRRYDDFLGDPGVTSGTEPYLCVKLKWYPIQSDNEIGPHTDPSKKIWINLFQPALDSSKMLTQGGPATCIKIAQFGPNVLGSNDIKDENQISIPMFYQSKWQWGGTVQGAVEHITNPCDKKPGAVSVANPATVAETVIRPWDMDKSGLINPDKFRQILSNSDYRLPKRDEPEADPEKTLRPPGQPEKPENSETESFSYFSDDSSDVSDSDEEGSHQDPRWVREKLRKITQRLHAERKQRQQLGRGILSLVENGKN